VFGAERACSLRLALVLAVIALGGLVEPDAAAPSEPRRGRP